MTIKAFRVRLPLFVGLLLATLLTTSVSLATDQDAFPGQQITQATLRFDDEVLAVAVQGDYAYVGLASGMAVLDIKQPLQPVVTGWTEGGAMTIAFSGKYAYNSDNGGFRVIDITDPHHPVKLYDALFPVGIADLAALGDYVYLATDFDLYVVDVHVPEAPEIVGIVYQRGILHAVDVAPDPATGRVYAYVVGDFYPDPGVGSGGHGGGLRVIDVTHPADPQEVWPCSNAYPCPGNGSMGDIVVQDTFAYIAYWNGTTIAENRGLNIWDISDPFHPQHVRNYYTEDPAPRVAVAGDRAYIIEEANGHSGGDRLHTIDVSDKAQPRGVAERPLDQLYTGSLAATVRGGCVFVPAGAKGLRIVCETSITPTPVPLVWLPLLTVSAG